MRRDELRHRCSWAENNSLLRAYHDEEWGVPERDSRALWEKLVLDGFQAGLSWITILRKREAFRRAFEGGCVVKFNRGGRINFLGPVRCLTAPYRPFICTSVDDNSVGDTISGSSGTGSPCRL